MTNFNKTQQQPPSYNNNKKIIKGINSIKKIKFPKIRKN